MISGKANLQENVNICKLHFSQSVWALLLLHKSTKIKIRKRCEEKKGLDTSTHQPPDAQETS
jgi:hypothetical protein